MKKMTLSEAVARSREIREIYHLLELQHHGNEWTVEEDALAFLTDAGLVGRLAMAHQGRWPVEEERAEELEHKLGECIWWLMTLADRMNIDAEGALETFLSKTEQQLKGSLQQDQSPPKERKRVEKSQPKSETKSKP